MYKKLPNEVFVLFYCGSGGQRGGLQQNSASSHPLAHKDLVLKTTGILHVRLPNWKHFYSQK